MAKSPEGYLVQWFQQLSPKQIFFLVWTVTVLGFVTVLYRFFQKTRRRQFRESRSQSTLKLKK